MAQAAPNFQPNRKLAYYCRIAKLLIYGGTEVLKEVFLSHAGTDVDTFLSNHKATVQIKFQRHQLDTLYPPSKKANVGEFDISLLSDLLRKICNLNTRQMKLVKDLKQQRNTFAHTNDAAISEADFKNKWGIIENILVDLAAICGPNYRTQIQQEIQSLFNMPLDYSENEQKYLQMLLQLYIRDIRRDDLEDVKSMLLEDRQETSRRLKNINANFAMLTICSARYHRYVQDIQNKLDQLSALVQAQNAQSDMALMKALDEIDRLVESNMASITKDIRQDLNRVSSDIHMQFREVNAKLDTMTQQRNAPVEINLFGKETKEAIGKTFGSMKNKIGGIFKDQKESSTQPGNMSNANPKETGEEKQNSREMHVVILQTPDGADNTSLKQLGQTLHENTELQKKKPVIKPAKQAKVTEAKDKSATQRYKHWDRVCEKEFSKALEQEQYRGCGPDTILLLDTSESMKGDNFTQMVDLAKQIIKDINMTEKMEDVLEENIGVVVYGSKTHILHHLTSNGVSLLDALDETEADGCSPLYGGLKLCLTALAVGDEPRQCNGLRITPRVILFTDGEVANNESTDASDRPVSFQDTLRLRQDVLELVDEYASKNFRLFCVPYCSHSSTKLGFLEQISHKTKARVVRPEEYEYLVKYYRRIIIGLTIREKSPGAFDETFLRKTIKKFRPPSNEDDLEAVMEIVVHPASLGYEGQQDTQFFHEVSDLLPPLGTRVGFGKDWREKYFQEHNVGNCVGTVIGQESEGFVWVKWDDNPEGKVYKYKYGFKNYHEVGVVSTPYPSTKGKVIVGNCVIADDQTDEEGNPDFGIIFDTSGIFGTVGVRWAYGGVQYHSPVSLMVINEIPEWCFQEDVDEEQA